MCPNYGFISFPVELTTGSSIMPHKKNPDVWEIMRGNCNRIMSAEAEISMLCSNMPHGYHREFQLLKDILFPKLELMHKCLRMAVYMLENIRVNEDILKAPMRIRAAAYSYRKHREPRHGKHPQENGRSRRVLTLQLLPEAVYQYSIICYHHNIRIIVRAEGYNFAGGILGFEHEPYRILDITRTIDHDMLIDRFVPLRGFPGDTQHLR